MIWFRVASLALLLFQLVLLGIRLPFTPSKVELLWFGAVLVFVAAAGFLPDTAVIMGLCAPALVWTIGMYARTLGTGRRAWAWHGGIGFALMLFLFARLIDLGATFPFHLLYVFLLLSLSLYPLILLAGICRRNSHPLLYIYLSAVALQLAAMVCDYLTAGIGFPGTPMRVYSAFGYCLVCGLLLAQEAYLQGSGWHGLHIRFGEQQKRLSQAHSRLIQTENMLMLQDRLIATGILTAGAAHEFKSTLSLIQTSAGYGLREINRDSMRKALQLITEQAHSGQRSVTEILNQLLISGREESTKIRLKIDLELLLRMVRGGCRREGIQLNVDIPEVMTVRVRRGELEQALVNLLRNAQDSVRSQQGGGERTIAIRARPAEGQAIIDVLDSGGGVDPGLQNRIFEPSFSGKQSTGLGLFLAKTLVERNDGTLSYVPLSRGGCFRIVLPGS